MAIRICRIPDIIFALLAILILPDAYGRSVRWDESDIIDSFPTHPLRQRYERIHFQIWTASLNNDISSAMDAAYLAINTKKIDSLRLYQADAFLWMAEELVREGDHLTAERCLRQAEKETAIFRSTDPKKSILNKLEALLAFQKARVQAGMSHYDKAIEEYQKALQYEQSGLSRSGIFGAMGVLYWNQGNDTLAEKYILDAIECHDEPNSSIAATDYLRFLLNNDRIDDAKEYILRDYPRLRGQSSSQEVYEARYRYYMLTGETTKAMENLAIAYDIQDSIAYEKTLPVLQDFALRMIDLNQENNRKHSYSLPLFVGISAAIAMFIIGIIFWRRKRKTSSHVNETASDDTDLCETDEEPSIERAVTAEAESSALNVIRKIANGPDQKLESQMEAIRQLLHDCELNDKTRNEFMTNFAEIYPDFLNRLYAVGPGLTKAEVRIACMCFLNMTTKEIASLTHRSIHTVNSIKRSLRKKLNITTGTEAWFHQLSVATDDQLQALRPQSLEK